jgi:hypothetical protein
VVRPMKCVRSDEFLKVGEMKPETGRKCGTSRFNMNVCVATARVELDRGACMPEYFTKVQ